MSKSHARLLAGGWPIRILIALGVAATSAAQAQNLYFHSPSEEKTATEVRDGIAAAKTAHLGALDSHRTYLQEAFARERRLLTQRELAERDEIIAVIVENQSGRGRPREELQFQIQTRLQELMGPAGQVLTTASGPYSLRNRRADLDDARESYRQALAARDLLKRRFEAGGGTGLYCEATGLPEPVQQTAGTDRLAFLNLVTACREMLRYRQWEDVALVGLPPSVRMILADPETANAAGDGELGQALVENANIVVLANAQKALGAAAKAHLKQLEDYYRCQLVLDAVPRLDAQIAETARQIQIFTNWLTTLNEADLKRRLEEQQQPAADPAAEPRPPACPGNNTTPPVAAPAKIETIADLAASAGINPAHVARALGAASEVSPGRALLAGIQEKAQEFQAGRLAELLGNIADHAAAEGNSANESSTARAVGATLRMIGHFDQLRSAESGTLPDTSAVLVRLAGARMRMATNKLEAERLQRVRQLSELRIAALRRETLDLLHASQLLASPGDSALNPALLRFSDSWTRGRVPARVARNDMLRAEMLAWADRERVAVEAAYGVLEPAVAELQAYGAGGIRPSEVAGYLNAVGVGAIAIGGQ